MASLVTVAIGRLRGRAERGQQGDTLIELLIAMVIIALTVTALLGGLVTAITSSTTQQSLSTVDAVLNNFAQSASYEAQQAFVTCTANPYRLISAPMPTSGPAGAEVTVFVTGFATSHALTVTVGGTTATTVSSNGSPRTITTDANGDATVSFLVPSGATGSPSIAVSDGTSTPSPTPFVVVKGATNGQTPVNYAVSVGSVQQWNAQTSSWVTSGSGTCPNSGAQQITAYATGPSGASGSLSFVILHSATTTVLVDSCVGTSPCPAPGSAPPPQPVLGATVTFMATVVPPNGTTPNPTGSVQWSFSQSPGTPTCSNGTNNISTLSNVAGGNTSEATCTVNTASVGTYEVTAQYPATGTTGNYGQGANFPPYQLTVGEANSSIVLTTSSSPSPAQPGSTLNFKATIGASPANANDPAPQDQVVWTITPPSGTAPTCNSANGDTQTLPNNVNTATNTTTCSFTLAGNAPTGTYSASAVYQGDGNYNPSQSTSPATISVSKATPTLSFSTSPQSPQTGSSFNVTVTVNGTAGITPAGNVTWTVTPPSGTAPTCTLATETTLSGGQATCTVNNAVTGTYTVAAAYGGNGAYNAASGSTPVAVTLSPAGFDIQSVGSPADNKPDSGDKIVYTYNEAMSLNSIMSGWNGSSVSVTASFSRSSGATSLTIQCTTFRCTGPNLGTVSLGDTGASHYISGGMFGGTNTVTLNATMAASTNAAGQTVITITLTSSSGQFSAVSGNTTLTWTPSNQATNAAGTACATTLVTESGSPKANF